MAIYDQYETESSAFLSGSHTDLIMGGDVTLRGFDNYQPRMIIGNKSARTTADLTPPNALSYVQSDLRALLNGNGFGSNSFLQCFNDNIVEDSVLPNPVDIVLVNSGSPIINYSWNGTLLLGSIPNTSSFSLLLGLTHTNPPLTASVPEGTDKRQVSDDIWAYSFPFESRYKSLSRNSKVTNVMDKQVQCYVSCSFLTAYYYLPNYLAISHVTKSLDFHASNGIASVVPFTDTVSSAPGLLTTTFCTQNFNLLTWYSFGKYLSKLPYASNATLFFEPRGFKYGVYSPIPVAQKTIFRRNKFGQIRDMLEQAPNTKYFKNKIYKFPFVDVAIEQTFVSGTDAHVTSSNSSLNNTESGMYDIFCRSGKPFDDTI